jgi:hypothetical protein
MADSSLSQQGKVKGGESGWRWWTARLLKCFWFFDCGCDMLYRWSREKRERAERIIWFLVVIITTPELLDANSRTEGHFSQFLKVQKAKVVLAAERRF